MPRNSTRTPKIVPAAVQTDDESLVELEQNPVAVYEAEENEDEIPLEDMEIIDRVRELHGKIGDGAQIYIYRIDDKGDEVYLEKIPALNYDQDAVKRRFGGGEYEIKGYYKRQDTGRTSLFLRERLKIAESVAEKAERERAANIAVSQNNSPQPQFFDMGALAQLLAENNRQLMENMARMIPKTDSKKDLLETFAVFKQLTGDSAGTQKGVLELVRDVLEVKQLAKELNSDAEPKSELAAAAEIFAPMLGKLMDQQPARANPASRQPQKPPISEEEKMNYVQQMALRTMLAQLLKSAAKNADVELYADVVLDQIDTYGGQAAVDSLADLLSTEDFLQRITSVLPDVQKHPEWFTGLRNAILSRFEAPSGEPAAGGQNGAVDPAPAASTQDDFAALTGNAGPEYNGSHEPEPQ